MTSFLSAIYAVRSHWCRAVLVILLLSFVPSLSRAWSPDELVPTTFTITNDVGFGNSVFVSGDVPELGNGALSLSRKLAFNSGNVWNGTIGLPPGTTVTYRLFRRTDSASTVGSDSNGVALGTSQTLVVPPSGNPQIPAQKTLFYHSGWSQPVLEWQNAAGTWVQAAMEDWGPGRSPLERRWRVQGFSRVGERVTFRIRNGLAGAELDTLPGSVPYRTFLDKGLLQDGNLYSYEPHPGPSPSRLETISNVVSPQGLLSRSLRVYLPRGYDEHTTRSYPVLYMHDGNNIYGTTSASFPPVRWNVDGTLNALIRQGQVREVIVVGIDNTANRNSEYGPATLGNDYLAYVRDTIKPLIDSTYRTIPDANVTGVAGSSLGGLISTHFGLEAPGTFRRIGAMSPSYWFHTATLNRLQTDPTLPPWRIYFDSGNTGDASNDGFNNTILARDHLLRRGLALNRNMLHVVGFGQSHNESAWQARFPEVARFLYPAEEEVSTVSDLPIPVQLSSWELND